MPKTFVHQCHKCNRKFIGDDNTECGNCMGMEVIEVPVKREKWTVVYPALVVALGCALGYVMLGI